MKRRHLFEIEDQAWFPALLRNYMTDFLQAVANGFDFYGSLVPVLKKALADSGQSTVVDLCSGGGGGWARLGEHLQSEIPGIRVELTDRFPNVTAFRTLAEKQPDVFCYQQRCVDALDVPADVRGLRTLFLAFHHFPPEHATKILKDAVRDGQPILIVEAQKRDLPHLLKFALSPIAVLLVTPFLRPLRWTRLLFTYVLPVVPLCVWWDGIISVLRTYTAAEMLQLADGADAGERFEWSTGELQSQATVSYLLGIPRTPVAPTAPAGRSPPVRG